MYRKTIVSKNKEYKETGEKKFGRSKMGMLLDVLISKWKLTLKRVVEKRS